MLGLDQTATVRTPNASNGRFDVTATTGLECRLVRSVGGASAVDRAEIAASGTLLWDASYVMPAQAQVEVSGERWNVVRGTEALLRGPTGTSHHRRALVERAS